MAVSYTHLMGGGFGGCTINLVKNELYDNFVEKTKEAFKAKFGRSPKVYLSLIHILKRNLRHWRSQKSPK